jgi:hypothetical protein
MEKQTTRNAEQGMSNQQNMSGNSQNQAQNQGDTGLSDLAYDWVTILHHKTKALRAYSDYIDDARKANSQECADLMQRIFEADRRQVEEIKQHVMQVLGGKMGQNGMGKSTGSTGNAS